MHPVRRQRLFVVMFILVFASGAVGLMLYALRSNINLFYPPAEVAAGRAPVGRSIRVGGMVVDGSVQRNTDNLGVRFDLTDYQATVAVYYEGIMPDLFREGQGAVAAGVLSAEGELIATQILAKHDESYMPPEVTDALDKAGYDALGRPQ